MRESDPAALRGLVVTAAPDAGLPVQVCAEHLALLGASRVPAAQRCSAGTLAVSGEQGTLECAVSWLGQATGAVQLRGEALIQAASGLMGVHGRDRRQPQRLGLDVASVAAGIVAAQGVLAALIGRRRGMPVGGLETSVAQGALLFLGHHIALGTCAEPFPQIAPGHATGPPFRTADGQLIEIEALSFGSWIGFWQQLGVERGVLEPAWSSFVYRYLSACCALPVALHEAVGQRTLADLRRAAEETGVAICRVRSYAELLDDPAVDAPPWSFGCGPGGGGATPHHPPAEPAAPLRGMRVVELTSRLQGPLAGLLLQMLGAEVVKVEPPGGDMGKHAPPLAGGLGAAYMAYNRGKQVVEIDYKQPGGRAQLADLAASADVFLHNWRSGRAEALGLDFADLSAANPRLVYAHASGWGRTVDEPAPIAGDFLVQAHAACGDGLNPLGHAAVPSRLTLVDVCGGLLACEGVLAALYRRERDGRGCRVDTSLLGAAVALQRRELAAMAAGSEQGRLRGRPGWGPLDQPVETADGALQIAADGPLERARLLRLLGLGQASDSQIADRLRARPAAEWLPQLHEAAVPAVLVRSDIGDLPHDPLLAWALVSIAGACWAPAPPWRFSA
ncbi:MAG TPA: CoA transferase [Roseiflexaceae bacterium]|nr:CoA transferase [Roseiflexaceae bacterium]